ncbi:MAG: fused MFS/spermidine synthase [Mariprofundaceae bacterium]|nr:fused MFS/spermidine synthase [Mariprofundaceae bacterium]
MTSYALLLLYGISGFTALAYEVLWMRLVSTLSGASNFGMVSTLVAFMAGLGLGAWLGARLRLRFAAALMLFAAVEMGVAITSMLMPDAVSLLEHGFEAMAASMGVDGWRTFHLLACVLLLTLPATALGLTFPVMLRLLGGDDIGVARIYGYNTLGGVLGALAPLVLLPWLGWVSALRMISGVGLMTGLIALALAWMMRRSGLMGSAPVAIGSMKGSVEAEPFARPLWTELAAYAGVGAAALMLEVGWTRLYSVVFMRTEYVLGVILAVMLLGIALGSLLSRRVGSDVVRILPPLSALSALLPLALLPGVSAWMEASSFNSLLESMMVQGAVMLVLTLLATVALGAWLPLIARRQANERSAAWLYAANSMGAAVGAAVAGWVLTPWLGSTATVVVAAGLLLLCGMYWMAGRARLLSLLIVPLMVWLWPFPAVSQLLPRDYGHAHTLLHYEDAVSMTDVVAKPDGTRVLLGDLQRIDASSDPTAIAIQRNQGRLPLLLRPNARNMLFLGLGTGITASAAHLVPGLKAVAVELSEGAIHAAGRWFAPFNDDAPAWLDIRHDDARRFLKADHHAYDVIVGDLFHPDMAGRGLLLSVQQFGRVHDRLDASGVYVQWLALNQFDLGSLKIVLASFRKVFPHNSLFLDGFHLAMAGFRGARPDMRSIKAWADAHPHALTGGEGWQTWLGRDLGSIPMSNAPLQDEWRPVVEFRLARARVEGRLDIARILAWTLQVRPRPEALVRRWSVGEGDADGVMRAVLSTDAMMHAWEGMFSGRSRSVSKFMQLAYQANPRDRWAGFAVADALADQLQHAKTHGKAAFSPREKQAWERILAIRPDHVMALRMLWRIAGKEGDDKQEAIMFQRLQRLVPFDPEVLAAGRGLSNT